MKRLEDYVVTIPDFPKKGIMFRDVTSVLGNADGLKLSVHEMLRKLGGVEFDSIAGVESRGFLFGMPLAYNKGKSFIPVRKAGKLPREAIREEYDLEYGKGAIEIHKDALLPGQRVVLVDDLLATGGTAQAAIRLIERLGGKVVKALFLMELAGLCGRDKLAGYDVDSVIVYPGA